MKGPLCLLLPFVAFTVSLRAAPREAEWKKFDELHAGENPRSALEALRPIEAAALAEKSWAEATKALVLRLEIAASLDEEENPARKLAAMEAELAKAPAEMQPVLLTLHAIWYADYFRGHRWEFMNRTRTGGGAGKDITTWDLPRLLAEIDARFQKALNAAESLKQEPPAKWEPLVSKGGLPDSYQPSLYDFLARQALEFYTSGEQAGANPGEPFHFSDSSPALGTMEEFLSWKPGDGAAPDLRTVKLYQDLLAFHKDDADPGARVLLDVERLEWAAESATGEGGKARKLQQLQALQQKHVAHEVSLRVRLTIADMLIKDDKPAEARALLLDGIKAFEKSTFAPGCRNLVKSIERKELAVSTEMVWNAAGPEILLTFRNVPRAHFRVWLLTAKPTMEKFMQLMKDDEEETLAKQMKAKPARAWSVTLPKADDYKQHGHREPAPVDLKPGLYLLGVSGDESFSEEKNLIGIAHVLVTPLALLTREREGNGRISLIEGWVLDALTGDPLPGAEVSVWPEDSEEKPTRLAIAKTDPNGFVSFALKEQTRAMLMATHGAHFTMAGDISASPRTVAQNETTYFFTDRALYRPGQTIQFKGIHFRANPDKKDYRVLPTVKRHVVLEDANRKEIATVDLMTNDYGSFSGSFTAPRTGLTGEFTIQDGAGQARVSVEEYKRPKFHVEIDPPTADAKLGAEIAVKVKALGYTGAPVDGAGVSWRVTRMPNWPAWVTSSWWWRHHDSRETEISHGTAKTAADGTVEVKFTAAPDPKVEEKDEPWFTFAVHADVTDGAGETRSGERGVAIGYASLRADVSADAWQTIAQPVVFALQTTSLDFEPRKAAGTLTVHRLVAPEKVSRPSPGEGSNPFGNMGNAPTGPNSEPVKDLSNPDTWETGEVVQRDNFATDEKGEAKLPVKLAAGVYRVLLDTKDAFGKKVTARTLVMVVDPAEKKFPVRIPFFAGAPDQVEPGTEFTAVWGTGYDRGRAFIEIEHRGKIVQRFWSDAARTQQSVSLPVTEAHRGGFTLHITQMHSNRLSYDSRDIDVPWSNRDLTLKWEHFTSKLQPGAKETWTLSVAGPDKAKAAAEVAAVLYDASLDAFRGHSWPGGISLPGYSGETEVVYAAGAEEATLEELIDEWNDPGEAEGTWPREWFFDENNPGRKGLGGAVIGAIAGSIAGRPQPRARARFGLVEELSFSPPPPPVESAPAARSATVFGSGGLSAMGASFAATPGTPGLHGTDHAGISARKNMQETAFFFPHLMTADDGTVKLEFTMPDAVTTWKFLGLAHDKALRAGFLSGEAVTARDLMIQPNPPRFLREGDVVEFTARITNQSDQPQQGTARLSFSDAATLAPADVALKLTAPEQSFDLPAKESRPVSWRITVPDGQGFLTWKATAGTDKMSDGEEGWLPVLPRRVPVTESLPLTVSEAGAKEYDFKKLTESAGSQTLKHQSLTVQVVSQPSWYAVLALPYLMEFPHECSEQVFNRFYANALAQHIANSDPKIRRTFDVWRDAQPEALESPLVKNQELASLLIEETPWLREASKETEQRRNIGLLFDANRINSESQRVLQKLDAMQLDDGSWPWFAGGRGNDFITLYIVAGFGRLKHLGVEVESDMAVQALDRLDAWIGRRHARIMEEDKNAKDARHIASDIALYLYGRSFFLEQRPVPAQHKDAVDFFLEQARKYWTDLPRMSQAHAALGLQRFGDAEVPEKILASLLERSVVNEESGRWWPNANDSWRWDNAPVESQAMMIEAIREIEPENLEVPEGAADQCVLWLLGQKRTQAWPTTKATADAVFAMMLSFRQQFSTDTLANVSLAGNVVQPEKVKAGTGFYEKKFSGADINAGMGKIRLEQQGRGPAWGSVHWQYLEDVGKITPHEGTPLKVTKSLFTKVNTDAGPELRPVTGKVKVGDELVVRLEIRTDRDMEFVHLKDQRPSSVEPVNVLSGYQWQDGLGYYESTRDAASHFFFDALPKGTRVFEYSARVQLRGTSQTGIAELQCMYAPEFNSHSASAVLEVE